MPELIQTFKAMQKTESEKRKFLASIQGVDLDESSNENEGDHPSKMSEEEHLV